MRLKFINFFVIIAPFLIVDGAGWRSKWLTRNRSPKSDSAIQGLSQKEFDDLKTVNNNDDQIYDLYEKLETLKSLYLEASGMTYRYEDESEYNYWKAKENDYRIQISAIRTQIAEMKKFARHADPNGLMDDVDPVLAHRVFNS